MARSGEIPFTPRAKRVLELSLREALGLGHDYIGTEHVLLGLVREGSGVAGRILLDFGADPESVRAAVLAGLAGVDPSGREPPGYEPSSPPVHPDAVEELERVRREKEEAIDGHDFERAAALRDGERRLLRAARELERAWRAPEARPAPQPGGAFEPAPRASFDPSVEFAVPPRDVTLRARPEPPLASRFPLAALAIGWFGFGAAVGIGLLLGWLIWG